MSEKKPTTVQVTKTPILVAHKDAIRHNVIEFFTIAETRTRRR